MLLNMGQNGLNTDPTKSVEVTRADGIRRLWQDMLVTRGHHQLAAVVITAGSTLHQCFPVQVSLLHHLHGSAAVCHISCTTTHSEVRRGQHSGT
jgi:hypothetical protein